MTCFQNVLEGELAHTKYVRVTRAKQSWWTPAPVPARPLHVHVCAHTRTLTFACIHTQVLAKTVKRKGFYLTPL